MRYDTDAAKALLRNNQPLLAYIGGKPARITRSKLTDFGPDAVGAHLTFPGTEKYEARPL